MIGGKPIRRQLVTVRPLIQQEGDVFGDASVLVSDTRGPAVQAWMQVSTMSGRQAEPGFPGRLANISSIATLRRKDIKGSWIPKTNDLVIFADGSGLFISDVQPAFPFNPSLGNPSGGFAGWRLMMTDRRPSVSPAAEYET